MNLTTGRRLRALALGAAGLAALVVAWQVVAAGPLADTSFPYAFATLQRLGELLRTGAFWSAVGDTLTTALAGFALAAVIGVPVGLAVGTNRYVAAALRWPLEFLRPIPPIVVLPLVVYRLGPTAAMSRFLTVVGLVPALVIATAAGVRDVDPVAVDTARSYRLGPLDRSVRVVLPAAAPFIVTGLRIAAFGAVLTTVMSEIVGGAPGLGSAVSRAQRANLPETTYAYVLAVALVGFAIDRAVTLVQRYLLRWHVSVRGSDGGARVRANRLMTPVGDALVRLARALPQRRRGHDRGTRDTTATDRWLLPLLSALTSAAILAWWWLASARSTSPFFIPLSKILRRLREIWFFDRFGADAVPSLRNLAVGYAIALVVGVAVGTLIGLLPVARELFDPVLALFRSLPGVAFVPILITVMGFGTSMRVTTIALAASFPVVIATADGLRSVDSLVIDVARAYRVPRWRRFTSVYLPAALPRIMTGAEIALSTALVVMIASELSGVTVGIGAQTILAQQTFEFADMWAGVILLVLLGFVTSALFQLVQRTLLAWYRGSRAAARAV